MIPQPASPRRGRRRLWVAVAGALAMAVFASGSALNMAIHDNRRPGPLVTVEHTV